MDVIVEKPGWIRADGGSIVLYGPYTDGERMRITRAIVAALQTPPREQSYWCERNQHVSCKPSVWPAEWACECVCHGD